MDILTQGLLGGVLAQSTAGKNDKRIATVCGVFSGLLADADILIGSSSDPLLNIEFHRHFTHSLIFVPVGAAIAMLLLWPFLRHRLPVSRLYLFCLAGYSMSGVLDSLTSYGTHLLWPFSDERVAFNIISIVDPVFTLILFVSLMLDFRTRKQAFVHGGLVLCVAYLGVGFMQQQRAEAVAMELASSREHKTEKHIVKPTLGNLLLWRSVYTTGEEIYVDAVRVGLLSSTRIYRGEKVSLLDAQRDLAGLEEDSVLYADIQRFLKFSEGYVAFDPERPDVLGDIRYSMLPTSSRPLWGITIDLSQPDRHVDYRFFRSNDAAQRQAFWNMLRGR